MRASRNLLILLVLSFTVSGVSAGERFRFGETTVKTSPGEMPDGIPPSFRYPGSTLELSGVSSATGYVVSAQGAVAMDTADDRRTVEFYYLDVLNQSGWTIIQSQRKEDRVLIMAESPFRKLVTLILTGDGQTRIRVYFKKSGGSD